MEPIELTQTPHRRRRFADDYRHRCHLDGARTLCATPDAVVIIQLHGGIRLAASS
jgi:hypothetical protein